MPGVLWYSIAEADFQLLKTGLAVMSSVSIHRAMAEAGFCERLRRAVTRTKVADAATSLQRFLTSTDLALMGIGGMLGSGVYILTGEVAGNLAGPAATLSFLIAGIVSLLTALLYTECATRVPRTGASYLFTYVGLGELAAFLVGWNVIILRVFVVAFAAKGWSAYFDNVIGDRVRNFTVDSLMHGVEWDLPVIAKYPDIIGGAVALLGAIPIALGTDLSAKANAFFVIVNVVTVGMVFVVSMIHADFSYLTNHGFFPMGFSGVIAGAAVCLGSGYGGFESILFSADEAKNPSRGLPIGIFSAYAIAILNYLAGVMSISVLAEYQDINPLSPFVTAFDSIGLYWMGYVVGVGGLCSMTGSVLNTIFCLSRNIFAMARDGLLPAFLGHTNVRTKTPIIATFLSSVLSMFICIFVDFLFIIEFISLGAILDYIVVGVVVISLRYKGPIKRGECTQIDGASKRDSDTEMTYISSLPETAKESDDSVDLPPIVIKDTDTPSTPPKAPTGQGALGRLCWVKWMRKHPTTTVLVSLAIHLLFEGIAVELISYNNDGLWKGDAPMVFGVTLCGGLALISCFPLLVLPQYGEGIPFKVPLMPYLPLLSLLCNVILAVQIELLEWIELIVWTIAGVIVYFLYSMHHSVEGKRH